MEFFCARKIIRKGTVLYGPPAARLWAASAAALLKKAGSLLGRVPPGRRPGGTLPKGGGGVGLYLRVG
jgi:hypothetical protein